MRAKAFASAGRKRRVVERREENGRVKATVALRIRSIATFSNFSIGSSVVGV